MSPKDLQAQALYVAECDALGFGPIGLDDCPPVAFGMAFVRTMTRAEHRADKARRARLARSERREPGARALRKVCKRAARNGVRTAPTFRAYVSHAFGVAPSPDRVRRIIAEFAPELPEASALDLRDPAEPTLGWDEAAPERETWGMGPEYMPDMPEDWREALAMVDAADVWGLEPRPE
jgi:hypothetical protein